MKTDGLHLTLESANTMAKEITKTIRENEEDQDMEEDITINPKKRQLLIPAKWQLSPPAKWQISIPAKWQLSSSAKRQLKPTIKWKL